MRQAHNKRINTAEGKSSWSFRNKSKDYDLLILGSGGGTKLLAWTFAAQGRRVAVVERKYIGGSCPNIACLPSKNVIHSAQIVSNARHSGIFGASAGTLLSVDMATVTNRKRTMVRGLVDAHVAQYKGSGEELIMESGRFVASKTLEATLNDGSTRRRELFIKHRGLVNELADW